RVALVVAAARRPDDDCPPRGRRHEACGNDPPHRGLDRATRGHAATGQRGWSCGARPCAHRLGQPGEVPDRPGADRRRRHLAHRLAAPRPCDGDGDHRSLVAAIRLSAATEFAPVMTELPSVTAVVPTRNRPALLLRAVRGILSQGYDGDLELIIVVDQDDPKTATAG